MLPLILPAPDVVSGLTILQSLQQCFVLEEDAAHFLPSLVAVQALADPATWDWRRQLLLLTRPEEGLVPRKCCEACFLGRQQAGLRSLMVDTPGLLVLYVDLTLG